MTMPGWYPDPSTSGLLRYWDGVAWSNHIARVGADEPAVDPAVRAAALREIDALEDKLAQLRREHAALQRQHADLARAIIQTDSAMLLQSVGIYHFAHPLDDAPAYKVRLDQLEERYKAVIKMNEAVSTTQKWAVNGSEKEGAKMVADLAKLMLRTYNNEVENVIKKLKPHTLNTAVERLEKLRATIVKLGASMKLSITQKYHDLRVEELRLTADFRQKEEEEHERLRAEKERMKEDARARKEQEAEQQRLEALLDAERQKYERAIADLQARGDSSAIDEHQRRLDEIEKMLDGVITRAANQRAGFVYVISNIGAFGEGIVKIGLTRRLDPLERIRELHNASVPFRFDVHAVVFSDDAVALETALHNQFEMKRVNLTNNHKEFFFVTPDEVKQALLRLKGDLLSFVDSAEALEWRQSEAMRLSARESVPPLP